MPETTFSLRGLDQGVAFQIVERADELQLNLGGFITRAEAITQARAEIAREIPRRDVSRSMFKRERAQREGK